MKIPFMKNKEDAVSSVVALMLILAIIVTCLAVYTASYVPGLKQQDEIIHSSEVGMAFERISADMDNLLTLQRNGSFTEPFSLGGGDILLSPVKSAGTVEILNISYGEVRTTAPALAELNGSAVTGVTISYTPVNTVWEKQGYLYQNGVLWLIKGAKKTPVSNHQFTIEDGEEAEKEFQNKITRMIQSGAVISGTDASLLIPRIFVTAKDNALTGCGPAKICMECRINDGLILEGLTGGEVWYQPQGSSSLINLFSSDASYTKLTVRYLDIQVSVV